MLRGWGDIFRNWCQGGRVFVLYKYYVIPGTTHCRYLYSSFHRDNNLFNIIMQILQCPCMEYALKLLRKVERGVVLRGEVFLVPIGCSSNCKHPQYIFNSLVNMSQGNSQKGGFTISNILGAVCCICE